MADFSNLSAVLISGTTSATAGTETTHAHNQNNTPFSYLVLPTANGVVYQSKPADGTNIYLKGSAASITFSAVLLFVK